MDCAVGLDAYSTSTGAGIEDRRPRLLTCGHCACVRCLNKLFHNQQQEPSSTNRNPNSVLCPFDRCETIIPAGGVEALKINYALMAVIEEEEAAAKPTPSGPTAAPSDSLCVECQHKPPEIHCPVCDTDLCRECANSVHSLRSLQPHKPSFMLLASKPKKAKPIPNCPTHGDPMKLWCLTDRAQICPSCVAIGDHNGHKANTIKLVAAGERKELEERLSRAQEVEARLLKKVIAANQAVDDVDNIARGLREKIEEDATRLALLIDNHNKELLNKLEQYSKVKSDALTAESTKVAQALNNLRSSITHVQSVIRVQETTAASPLSAAGTPTPTLARSPPLGDGDELDADLAVIREKELLLNRVEAACDPADSAASPSAAELKVDWSGLILSSVEKVLDEWLQVRDSQLESVFRSEEAGFLSLAMEVPFTAELYSVPPPVVTPPPSQPFRDPNFIAVYEDNIYITDANAHSVLCFSTTGAFVPSKSFGSEGSADGQFDEPFGIVVVDGLLYIADCQNKRICEFNSSGTFIRQWPVPFNPMGLAFGGELLFITAQRDDAIHAYRLNGSLVRTFGSAYADGGGLCSPWGICYYMDHLFVTNRSITEYGQDSVSVFRSDGQFVRRWGSYGPAPGQLSQPSGVAVHRNQIFISDANNHRISIFSIDGTFLRSVGTQGDGLDQFDFPEGIAITDRYALVVDCGNNRIQCIPRNSL